MVASRGRIMDDDDEDEYDSELDDFIDDGEEEGDYSSYIKEIFGYDKSRYRGLDDDVDNMETSFAQQMKEEVISTKIGKISLCLFFSIYFLYGRSCYYTGCLLLLYRVFPK